MKEVVGDLWTYPADVRVITTNGTINSKQKCVMGRGCAREAALKFPELPTLLAFKIRAEGNHPYDFPDLGLISFPVKHEWFERADLTLIRTSALQLKRMLDPDKIYVMGRPGCGNGGREWREVKPLLADLPDNVHVITWANQKAESEVTSLQSQPSSLPSAA